MFFLVAGCGSSPPTATKAAPIEASAASDESSNTPATRSEIGGLNEEAVAKSFERMNDAVQNCFATGTGKINALGGHLKMKLRIDSKGALKWAYMSESTLGDRDTEKCLLDAARAKSRMDTPDDRRPAEVGTLPAFPLLRAWPVSEWKVVGAE